MPTDAQPTPAASTQAVRARGAHIVQPQCAPVASISARRTRAMPKSKTARRAMGSSSTTSGSLSSPTATGSSVSRGNGDASSTLRKDKLAAEIAQFEYDLKPDELTQCRREMEQAVVAPTTPDNMRELFERILKDSESNFRICVALLKAELAQRNDAAKIVVLKDPRETDSPPTSARTTSEALMLPPPVPQRAQLEASSEEESASAGGAADDSKLLRRSFEDPPPPVDCIYQQLSLRKPARGDAVVVNDAAPSTAQDVSASSTSALALPSYEPHGGTKSDNSTEDAGESDVPKDNYLEDKFRLISDEVEVWGARRTYDSERILDTFATLDVNGVLGIADMNLDNVADVMASPTGQAILQGILEAFSPDPVVTNDEGFDAPSPATATTEGTSRKRSRSFSDLSEEVPPAAPGPSKRAKTAQQPTATTMAVGSPGPLAPQPSTSAMPMAAPTYALPPLAIPAMAPYGYANGQDQVVYAQPPQPLYVLVPAGYQLVRMSPPSNFQHPPYAPRTN